MFTVTAPSTTVMPSTRPSPSSSCIARAWARSTTSSSRFCTSGVASSVVSPRSTAVWAPAAITGSSRDSGVGEDRASNAASTSTAAKTCVGDVVGERRLRLRLGDGVADDAGHLLAVERRRFGPHGHGRDHEDEDRQHAEACRRRCSSRVRRWPARDRRPALRSSSVARSRVRLAPPRRHLDASRTLGGDPRPRAPANVRSGHAASWSPSTRQPGCCSSPRPRTSRGRAGRRTSRWRSSACPARAHGDVVGDRRRHRRRQSPTRWRALPGFFDPLWLVLAWTPVAWASSCSSSPCSAAGGRSPATSSPAPCVGLLIAVFLAAVLGEGAWDRLTLFADVDGPPAFPPGALTFAAAVIATASPHLSRPFRHFGRWIVGGQFVATMVLGTALPSGSVVAVIDRAARRRHRPPHRRLTRRPPDDVADRARPARARRRRRRADTDGACTPRASCCSPAPTPTGPIAVKVYGRDAWDAQLLDQPRGAPPGTGAPSARPG